MRRLTDIFDKAPQNIRGWGDDLAQSHIGKRLGRIIMTQAQTAEQKTSTNTSTTHHNHM